jgi:hypothetical protein
VATLVTSAHLNVDIRVITKTRANPVMMIQNPYLSLRRSISSAVDVGVVLCISTAGSILVDLLFQIFVDLSVAMRMNKR